MRWTHWLFLLCFAATVSAARSDEATKLTWLSAQSLEHTVSQSLDLPQPDTIFYDDGTPQILLTGTGYWCSVRFTPLVDFNIVLPYLRLYDGGDAADTCSLFVYLASPAPGVEPVTMAVRPGPQSANGWIDNVFFEDTVTVLANQDFWVVFGPVAGGGEGDLQWNTLADGGSANGRSKYSTSGRTGTYVNLPYDWIMRVGGTAANTFVDIAADDLSNEVGELGPRYDFLLGEPVTFTQVVSNIGSGASAAFTCQMQVTNSGGSVVFSEELVSNGLGEGATASMSTMTPFNPAANGEYLARSVIFSAEDASAENDTAWFRFFVGGNPRWYRYDDNQAPESYLNFSVGSGWGLIFTPAQYPAELSQFKINVNGAATGTLLIWTHDSDTLPAPPAAWTVNTPLVQGWNTITPNPPVTIFDGQSLTIGYLFAEGAPMGYDLTPPNAAGIDDMGPIAVQLGTNGTTIVADDGGNLCIQAYFDTSSATPPFPVISTNRDTMDFGTLNPNEGSTQQSLWVYNEGGVDPLNVTGIVINPPSIRAGYTLSQTVFTVAAGDSEEVIITFDPVTHRNYNGLMAINNNSNNNQAYGVILRAMGDSTFSAVIPMDLPLPNEFALSQNFPNPFNPETHINFSLPVSSEVRLTVVNMLGQEVAELASGRFVAGTYSASFNGADLPSGLYFYRLDAGNFTGTRKMMLIK